MTSNTDTSAGLEPAAGGHPAHLVRTAAEQVRAANHTLARLAPVPGLVSGSDVYDTVGALYQLTSRLPQLCKQIAAVLTAAAAQGTLTGLADAPELAAQWPGRSRREPPRRPGPPGRRLANARPGWRLAQRRRRSPRRRRGGVTMPEISDQELAAIQDLKVSESWARLQLVRLEQIIRVAVEALDWAGTDPKRMAQASDLVAANLRMIPEALRRGDGWHLEQAAEHLPERFQELAVSSRRSTGDDPRQ
jgi:hypothetical protein